MKVTDGTDGSTEASSKKVLEQQPSSSSLKEPHSGESSNTNGTADSGDNTINGNMNGSSSLNSTTTTTTTENGTTSDKENSKPIKDSNNKKASKSSKMTSRSNRSSEERNPSEVKVTNGANNNKNETEETENNVEDESTTKEDDENGKAEQTNEDVFYVHDAGLTIKIVAPGAEPFEIQVSSSEIVQELHQLLMEREDTCHRTCFSLQLDGTTLDNFAELKSIPGLKDGSVIKVVEEPYTCREARIHVKHVRDLLKPSDWADAYAGTDCASLSFLNAVSGGESGKNKRMVDCTPPEYIMPGNFVSTANSLLLNPLHPLNKDQKPIGCLKVLAASGWNPPPGHRKLHGDLMYLLVVTLEDKICNVTASPRGFYLNRS